MFVTDDDEEYMEVVEDDDVICDMMFDLYV